MALIDTIPTTDATKPAALSQVKNGQLPDSWLRSFDGTTRVDFKAFVPVSYAIQAMHLAAKDDGIALRTTGRYRPLLQQQNLFAARYKSGSANNDGCGSKLYNGVIYYLQRSSSGNCYAMAAVPGTSNHGWGIADDFSEWDEGDPTFGSSLDQVDLQWLADNARSFFFALDIRSEPWHWHWYNPANPNTLSQRTVDVLTAKGVKIPDLSTWGFTVPKPSTAPPPTPEEDEDVIAYSEIISATTAPPVSEVVAGRADRWLNAALLRTALFDVTGSDEYDQDAALKLDAALKRRD